MYGTNSVPRFNGIQKIWNREAEDNLSVQSSFIANAHNGLHVFTRKRAAFREKNSEPIGGRPPHRPPSWIRHCRDSFRTRRVVVGECQSQRKVVKTVHQYCVWYERVTILTGLLTANYCETMETADVLGLRMATGQSPCAQPSLYSSVCDYSATDAAYVAL